jgi:serine/threonine protein kinase/tetratricopeptide (TPR) repeat protein
MTPNPLLEEAAPNPLVEDQPTVPLRTAPRSKIKAPPEALKSLEATARAYQQFRQAQPEGDVTPPDSWCRSHGMGEHARLFRDLHSWDPQAADRLARALTSMPPVGSDFLDFHLQAQLGRGAFARVYLARQGELANRPVVVKIAADLWGEAQKLAQLQHPNIVPVYSVHHRDPFQVVCMPYLGWTTLQDVLRHVNQLDRLPQNGTTLIDALKKPPAELPIGHGTRSATGLAAPTKLASLSYVEAVVWLAAQLADGLAHAHEHGIVHHDLKPANILLTDDGRPMLLDFNAAEDIKRPKQAAAWVAGTLPYMAPEQIAALQGTRPAVDARCDLFAFGVILFELLTGRYPYQYRDVSYGAVFDQVFADRRGAPPPLRKWNPAVTPALEAIVRRCLEPDPRRRYQSARDLCDDLQRQHDHRPLLHQAEPSQAERLTKWAHRHSRLLVVALIAMLATIGLLTFGAFALSRGRELERLHTREVERLAKQTQRDRAKEQWDRFRREMKTAQFILYTRINEPEQRAEGIKLGNRLIESYGVLGSPAWEESPGVQALSDADQQELGDAMGELLLLQARGLRLQYTDAPADERVRGTLEQALQMLVRAEACSKQAAESPGLWTQRADLQATLGRHGDAKASRARAAALPLRTTADRYWLASTHIAAGRPGDALPLLQDATSRDPHSFWAWFVLANCYDRLNNDAEAKACYGTCVALKPDFVWAHFNHGLALLRKQEYRGACADFDRVLHMRPDLADAYLNRALARQGLEQFREADQDLTSALERGGPTRLYFLRARVREKLGDKEGAQRDFLTGATTTPADEKSWIARGYYLLTQDPQAALADFDEALRLNPRSADALQNKAHVLAERLGQTQEAVAVLDRALDLYPESVKARCGRGVLHARLGQRDLALRDAEETLRRDSSPPRLYQVACIYALTSRQEPADRVQAFQHLSASLRQDYGFNLLDSDDDLDPLRATPEFRRRVDAARALRSPPDKAKKR